MVLLLAVGLTSACAGPLTEPALEPPPPPASGPIQAALQVPKLEAQTQPNVLLITMDTLRADAVGIYGDPRLKTPAMDSLGRQGTRFSLAMTPEPQTNPTHASIFTGMFPGRHGVMHHMASLLSPDVKPIAEILSEAGYATAGHYSWISFDPQYSGLERGFATYERHTVDRSWPSDRKADWYEQYLDSKADVTTDGVLSWAENGVTEPFFLWIHYNDAHWPYAPPAPFDTMFDQCQTCLDGSMDSVIRIAEGYSPTTEEIAHLRGLYDGEVAFEDQQLGRVIDWMRDKGILDNTIVVLTADHGEGFWEKGLWSHQEVLYNTAARVPLIIRYPAMAPAGGVVDAPVSTVDILPTILDMLGMTHPGGLEGYSMLPLILGQQTSEDRAVFSQLWDGGKLAVVYRGMKLIENRQTGTIELYDVRSDPAEASNLVNSQPDVARDLKDRLDEWAKGQGLGP